MSAINVTATAMPPASPASSTAVASWADVRAFNQAHMGRLITDEINCDAEEVAALRRALRDADEGRAHPRDRA